MKKIFYCLFWVPQTTICLKEIIQPSTTDWLKRFLFLEQKFLNGDLQEYTNICFPSALPLGMRTYSSWMSADVFSDTNQKHVFACCCVWQECIFYNVELFEVYKMSEVFWAKKYCKMRDIFASFSWLWDFLTENLKLVDKLQM